MFVDAAVQFLADHVEHATEYLNLPARKMEGFVGGVVEEFVSADFLAQGSPFE